MEEEIDLRQYIVVLWKRKLWIAGLTIGAALVALVVSFLLPRTYEATAMVVVVRPRYIARFDSQVNTNVYIPPNKVYLNLATSNELLIALGQDLDLELNWKNLKVTSGDDPSVVNLKVSDRDPQRAVRIVNRWAELLVSKAHELFNPSDQDKSFFQSRLAEAQAALDRANQDLIDFQSRNQLGILNQKLDRKLALLRDYISNRDSLTLFLKDMRYLKQRLEKQDPTAQIDLADELNALYLQMAAQGPRTSPVQLQITGLQNLSGKTVQEQIALLDSLILIMQEKWDAFEQDIQALTPEILELQSQIEQYNVQQSNLRLTRDVAQNTVASLTREIAELDITAYEERELACIASRASTLPKPFKSFPVRNIAIAGMLGLMIGVFGVLAVEWWKSGADKQEE